MTKTPMQQITEALNNGGTLVAGSHLRAYTLTKKHLPQITETKGGFNIQNGKSKVFVFFYQCKLYGAA